VQDAGAGRLLGGSGGAVAGGPWAGGGRLHCTLAVDVYPQLSVVGGEGGGVLIAVGGGGRLLALPLPGVSGWGLLG